MSKADFHSRVPAEVADYHGHLQAAAAAGDALSALDHLWQAFEYYLEPEPLVLAIRWLAPWPLLQQGLQHFGGLICPDQIQACPKPAAPVDKTALPAELEAWADFVFPARRPRISVCMIVRNEAACLAKALDSVQGLADEIVVVDTGSSDGTQAIAAAYAKVVLAEIEWPDDFAVARNHSLQLASGDWVMILDADEVLLSWSRDFLQACFRFPPLGWQIYTCQINHLLQGGRFFTWTTRIFRRDPELRFSGGLHEMPRKRSWPPWLLEMAIPGVIEHSGNLPEVYALQQKAQRVQKLRALVEDPHSYTPFLAYHYAHLLVNSIDVKPDPQLAERLLLASLAEAEAYQGKLPPHPDWIAVSVPAVALLLAQLWSQQGHHAGVAELYERYAATCRVTSFPALGAASLAELGRLQEARVAWLRCFDPGLIPIKQPESWKQMALEGLLRIGLQLEDGFLALWAVRRLRERFPSGRFKTYDLPEIQRQLEALLELPPGHWLARVDQEIRLALERQDLQAVAFLALVYLCEAWNHTVLGDALRALHSLGAPALAHAVAAFGRSFYPHEALFQAFGGSGPTTAGLPAGESRMPGGAYWLWLLSPPKQRPQVSLCMIVRNAADTLPSALRSLEAVVDEYVIADTGSDDATRAVIEDWARSHRVVSWQQPWNDDFAAARNAVLDRASGAWVLVVDADELLTPESVPRLQQLFAYAPAGLQLIAIRCVSLYPDPGQISADWVPRIFQRHELIRYWGAVHNIPGHAREAEPLPVVPFAGVSLIHSGFLPAMVKKHRKADRLQRLERILTVGD
ncbi:MAG TPA: glycosyltransferase, partial [Candidatus Obscuribacterales bacterium]